MFTPNKGTYMDALSAISGLTENDKKLLTGLSKEGLRKVNAWTKGLDSHTTLTLRLRKILDSNNEVTELGCRVMVLLDSQ